MTLFASLLQVLLPLLTVAADSTTVESAELLFAGDAMMHQAQISAAQRKEGTFDFSSCFSALEPYVSSFDYAVVNLEAPLGGAPYRGYPCFSAPDEYATALTAAGFDFFLLANNHMLDRRDAGLRRTLNTLDSLHIPHTGVFRSSQERDSVSPAITDIKGFKTAILNYTYGTNGFTPHAPTVVNYINEATIEGDIKKARAQGAEIVIACIHWGDEYKLLPNATQKRLADKLTAMGADMIIGGHPHVVQPMEMRTGPDGKPVVLVYSLGNLISNMGTSNTRGGAMVRVRIERDPSGVAHVASAAWSLVHVDPPSCSESKNFMAVPAHRSAHPNARTFVNTAERLFREHNVEVGADSVFVKTL